MLAALAAVIVFSILLIVDGDGDGDPDPVAFADFIDSIARAAEDGDAAFFIDRVQGIPIVCTEADVAAAQGPDAPPQPVCTEVGIEFEAIAITNYGAAGAVVTPGVLITDIRRFFADALEDEEDEYGVGAVRLFATATPLTLGDPTGNVHTAILTSVEELFGRPGRFVRALDFTFIDGRWVIQSETTASFPIAVDLLKETTAVPLYQEWERY